MQPTPAPPTPLAASLSRLSDTRFSIGFVVLFVQGALLLSLLLGDDFQVSLVPKDDRRFAVD